MIRFPVRRLSPAPFHPTPRILSTLMAWLVALVWLVPFAFAVWTAFHPPEYMTRFHLLAPLTMDNFLEAWTYAPFLRYMVNTVVLVLGLLSVQYLLGTLAGFAFARFDFAGSRIAFGLVLVQLMITPEILIVANYRTMAGLGLVDSIPAIALPYAASAFGIFLLRQTFKQIPRELEDAARIDGAGWFAVLRHIYVPLSRSTYLAWGLVSVSTHWNDFLWPLVITNSVRARPLTVGLAIFAAPESGVNWAVLCAGTLIAIAPLVTGFLVFQKQFTDSFLRAGIK